MIVIVAAGKSLLSRLISLTTKSEYTHTIIQLPPPYDMLVLHSTIFGVRLNFLNKIKRRYKKYISFECLDSQVNQATLYIAKKLDNEKYDYLSLFLILLNKIFKTKKLNEYRKNKSYNCVEVFLEIMKNSNIEFDFEIDKIETPQDIIDELRCSKLFKEI
jgi:hypothetical protein